MNNYSYPASGPDAGGWVTPKEAHKQLVAAGFPPIGLSAGILIGCDKRGMKENDLKIALRAAKELGVENLGNLAMGFRKREKCAKHERRELLARFVETFYHPLGKLLKAMSFRRHKIVAQLSHSADAPFDFSISLGEPGKVSLCRINFSLYVSTAGKPIVVLGNMQGFYRDGIERLKTIVRMPVLNFFIAQFKKAFPKREQLIALHPRHHTYFSPSQLVIINQLAERGKITKDESEAWHLYRDTSPEQVKNVQKTIDAEAQRIRTVETGMHKAAYKKGGFRLGKAKFLRQRFRRG